MEVCYRNARIDPGEESDSAFDFEPAIERMEKEREKQFADLAPKRKIATVCLHWLRGLCHKNEFTCERYHVYEPSMFPICQFYLRNGCTNPDCIFRHPVGEKEYIFCVDYARGFCKRGPKCTEKHLKVDSNELKNINEHVQRAIASHRRAQRRKPGDESDPSDRRSALRQRNVQCSPQQKRQNNRGRHWKARNPPSHTKRHRATR